MSLRKSWLFYFKCYPNFEVAELLFNLDRNWAEGRALPERKLETIEEFITRFLSVTEVMIDGTEQPIQRPQDQQKQKEHYLGKKKGSYP